MCWSSLIRLGSTRLNTLPTPAFASASVACQSASSWTCCSFSFVVILASSASTFCSIPLSGADLAGASASSSLVPPAANAAPPVSAIAATATASLPLPFPIAPPESSKSPRVARPGVRPRTRSASSHSRGQDCRAIRQGGGPARLEGGLLTKRLTVGGVLPAPLSRGVAASAPAAALKPMAERAPESALATADATNPACTTPSPTVKYAWLHCYTAQDIRAAYGVSSLPNKGDGQTIVLVDSYGTPTGAQDLKKFHDTFFPGEPAPNFTALYPNGQPDFKNVGNGQSGSSGAEGWAGEATLDIEWAYAIAPHAHIVLLGVPPAETEGVQGFPNLFKAISDAIDKYPAGTVFSQSFGVTEQTFGGAAQTQTAKFDAVYKKAIAKGDTVLASSGDDGTTGPSKRHRDSVNYTTPTAGWPATSPYVTAVGGTQLQYGWTWKPTSDVAFTADGDYNPAYFAYDDGGNTEPVWNESWLPAATGGGPSAIYS